MLLFIGALGESLVCTVLVQETKSSFQIPLALFLLYFVLGLFYFAPHLWDTDLSVKVGLLPPTFPSQGALSHIELRSNHTLQAHCVTLASRFLNLSQHCFDVVYL